MCPASLDRDATPPDQTRLVGIRRPGLCQSRGERPAMKAARRRRKAWVLLAIVGAVLLGALSTALSAERHPLHVGDLIVEGEGGFAPQALPRKTNAPITLHGGGSISTA